MILMEQPPALHVQTEDSVQTEEHWQTRQPVVLEDILTAFPADTIGRYNT